MTERSTKREAFNSLDDFVQAAGGKLLDLGRHHGFLVGQRQLQPLRHALHIEHQRLRSGKECNLDGIPSANLMLGMSRPGQRKLQLLRHALHVKHQRPRNGKECSLDGIRSAMQTQVRTCPIWKAPAPATAASSARRAPPPAHTLTSDTSCKSHSSLPCNVHVAMPAPATAACSVGRRPVPVQHTKRISNDTHRSAHIISMDVVNIASSSQSACTTQT